MMNSILLTCSILYELYPIPSIAFLAFVAFYIAYLIVRATS